ncbi:MAG TPA: PAS domain-containing protein [Gemmatimonadales bacterium]|jgi:PAS domain S-box-containing protein
MTQDKTRGFRSAAGLAVLGGVGVVALAYGCERLHLDVATTAMLLLIGVVLLSLTGSFGVTAIVAAVAVGSLHVFFIAPRYTWGIEDSLDFVALAAFLFTALVVTRLLSRARASLGEAQTARNELRLAIDTVPALIWTTLPDGTGELSNARWLEFTGLSSREAEGWGYASALHPEDYERLRPKWTESFREGATIEDEARLRRADGTYRWFLHRAVPLRDAKGDIVRWYGTSIDIEDRKRAQEELREAERALRRARERAMKARFSAALDERTRLAREIHDTLLQGFTGIALKLVAATSRLPGPPETVAALRDVIDLAQKTLVDARRAVWDLRSPSGAGTDFTATLRTAAEDCARGTGLRLEYAVDGEPRPLGADAEGTCVRVVQEAITNVVKHAAATTVRVHVAFGERRLLLSVTDDGRGFDMASHLPTFGGHWGLLGMRERASRIRGKLRVRSTPGLGTEVALRIPYAAAPTP